MTTYARSFPEGATRSSGLGLDCFIALFPFVALAIPEAKLLVGERFEELGPNLEYAFEQSEWPALRLFGCDSLDPNNTFPVILGDDENLFATERPLDERFQSLFGFGQRYFNHPTGLTCSLCPELNPHAKFAHCGALVAGVGEAVVGRAAVEFVAGAELAA